MLSVLAGSNAAVCGVTRCFKLYKKMLYSPPPVPSLAATVLSRLVQIGGSEHDAEIHWVHAKQDSEDDLLVVGVLLDASNYASNMEVSPVR